jgi:uncharacterized protein (DUF58 family)
MSLLDPALLQRLGRSRLNSLWTLAHSGVGERRSRAKGSGIEFADHRDYQPGDDIRHLDRHVYARLGQHVIKQFALYQQLQVTLLVDASASMGFGGPEKLRRAAELAGVLSYSGLSGGDRVRVGAFQGGKLAWHPNLHGTRQIAGLFDWLERLSARGVSDLASVARESVPRLSSAGLLIVLSDWLDPTVPEALAAWHQTGQELLGIQVLAPEEVEPERLGNGPVRLLDVETGREVEVSLDDEAAARYRENLADWNDRLRQAFYRNEGRLFPARSDDDLERTVLGEWRVNRLIS